MNENLRKFFEYKLQNLMNLRSVYYAVIIALTGGVVSLLDKLTNLHIFLILIGSIIDYIFINQIFVVTTQINKILKFLKEA